MILMFASGEEGREERAVRCSLKSGETDFFPLNGSCLIVIPMDAVGRSFSFPPSVHLEHSAFDRCPRVGAPLVVG